MFRPRERLFSTTDKAAGCSVNLGHNIGLRLGSMNNGHLPTFPLYLVTDCSSSSSWQRTKMIQEIKSEM